MVSPFPPSAPRGGVARGYSFWSCLFMQMR